MQELLVSLLFWISSNSILNYDGSKLPRLAFVTEQRLNSMAFGNHHPSAIRTGKYRVAGLYHHELQTIFLVRSVNLESESGKALLVHELVHFLQYQNGDEWLDSIADLEQLAYTVEAAYSRSK